MTLGRARGSGTARTAAAADRTRRATRAEARRAGTLWHAQRQRRARK